LPQLSGAPTIRARRPHSARRWGRLSGELKDRLKHLLPVDDPVFARLCLLLQKVSAMMNLLHKTRNFLVNEDGPTAVEYAVMLALIIVVCLTAIQAIGTNANATFNSVATKLQATAS